MKKLSAKLMKLIEQTKEELQIASGNIESYVEERSEKWQEDNGSAWEEWKELLDQAAKALMEITERPEV